MTSEVAFQISQSLEQQITFWTLRERAENTWQRREKLAKSLLKWRYLQEGPW